MTAAEAIVTTPSASEMITMHYGSGSGSGDNSNDAIEDRAEKAYESIAATLESWTSPKLRQQQQQRSVVSSLDNNNSNEEW